MPVPEPKDILPGIAVSVRAAVLGTDGDTIYVTILGPRPPFTMISAAIGLGDIIEVLGETPAAPEPLQVGDRVRDQQGYEWEVLSEPKTSENGQTVVALWSAEHGMDHEDPVRLERIST